MAKFAVTVRVVALGVIILVLLVPLALIGGITTERAKRRETVFQEVAAVWGLAARVGPRALDPVHRRRGGS